MLNLHSIPQGLDLRDDPAARPPASACACSDDDDDWADPVTPADVANLFDTLLGHGFPPHHARAALTALSGPGSSASTADLCESAALDWLCLHIPASDLPRHLAGAAGLAREPGAGGGEGVRVLAASDPRAGPGQSVSAAASPPPPAPPSSSSSSSDDEAAAAAAAAAAIAAAAKQKAWIMRYMEEHCSSEEDEGGDERQAGGSGSDRGASGSDRGSPAGSTIEDWEVWGDPREVARRKAARARAAVPPEVRRDQLAGEWATARAEAARAKGAGDTARQKLVGRLIGALKQEATGLGLTDADLEAALGGAGGGGGGGDDAPSSSSDSDDGGPGLFGGGDGAGDAGDGAPPQWEAPKAKPPTVDDLLAPWGFEAAGETKKGKKSGGGKPGPPPEPVKPPKAVLQSLCQRAGAPAPRFERLDPGGLRMETAGTRYSVSVEATVGAAAQGRSAKAGGASGRKPPPRTFRLAEAEDGWEAIQDAQNAVATRALYEVTGGTGPAAADALRLLGEPFRGLWVGWAAADGAMGHGGGGGGSGGPAGPGETDAEDAAFFADIAGRCAANAVAAAQAAAAETAAAAKVALETEAAPSPPPTTTTSPLPSPSQSAQERAESEAMAADLTAFEASPAGADWAAARGRLPVVQIREPLLAALGGAGGVGGGDVAVVAGETGSGKTTQVPQFLLEAMTRAGQGGVTNIICTQPRRIAAISVAERVAAERGEPPPGKGGGRVGYHVRLDAARTRATRLLFCTTGILLRRLVGDADLAGVSHVVVDEVHERTLQGDFLMALLKELVLRRRAALAAGLPGARPLKVVLMSATLDSSLFASYFGGAATLEAGGRTFPVDHLFLEDAYDATGYALAPDSRAAVRPDRGGARGGADRARLERGAGGGARGAALVRAGWGDDAGDAPPLNKHFDPAAYVGYSASTLRNLARLDETVLDLDLVEEVVAHIHADRPPGAVLVFLPGLAEITALADRLAALPDAREGHLRVLPLHSSVSAADQRRVFDRPPPGVRKIVLATNIAETSITIDDVVYCVDSGKHRERRHDPTRGMGLLVEDFVSRASALQRKGRAGRVQAGTCFGLYTRARFEQRMRTFQSPEMVRVPLEELVLQIHALGLGPAAAFLGRVLEPPPPKAVAGAVAALTAVGALTRGRERLTPLGRHLAALPLDPRLGKLLLYGAALGCLGPALTIAASLAHRPPFATPLDDQAAVGRVKAGMAAPGSKTGGPLAAGQQSDHLLAAAAYAGWAAARAKGGRAAGAAHARSLCLSIQALEMLRDMRAQFAAMLADSGFVRDAGRRRGGGGGGGGGEAWFDDLAHPANAHAGRPAVVKAALAAALYPNVAVMDEGSLANATAAGNKPAWHDGSGPVALHPGSVNAGLAGRAYGAPYTLFLEKVRTSRTFLRDTTVVGAVPLLLFGGALDVRHGEGTVLIDGWLTVRAAAPTAVLVKKLRAALDAALAARVGGGGGGEDGGTDASAEVVAAIVDLLQDEAATMGAAVSAAAKGASV